MRPRVVLGSQVVRIGPASFIGLLQVVPALEDLVNPTVRLQLVLHDDTG